MKSKLPFARVPSRQPHACVSLVNQPWQLIVSLRLWNTVCDIQLCMCTNDSLWTLNDEISAVEYLIFFFEPTLFTRLITNILYDGQCRG